MAFSIQRAVSDGTMTLLPISIEYFDREEISVLFDGVLNARQWAWVGTTDKTLSFTPAVADTVEVMVVRSTDLSELRHQFSLGAQFTAESLDESLLQVLHIAQEATERQLGGDFFTAIDMHGSQITNLGAATAPDHAVTLAQYQADASGASAAKDTAVASASTAVAASNSASASASAALLSANNAGVSESNALSSANSASASASTASTKAAEAAASAAAALVSENAAELAESNAKASEVAAAASAAAALHPWEAEAGGIHYDLGNVRIGGVGKRITGDFSNATIANRVMFQTSVENAATNVEAIPNGTSLVSSFAAYGNQDTTNTSVCRFTNTGGELRINSTISGAGTYIPMTFYTGGSERMRVDTNGKVSWGSDTAFAAVPSTTAPMFTFDANDAFYYDRTNNIFNLMIGSSNYFSVASTGVVVAQPTGLGYGTGAGGTVTQATSKSTDVTLNKPTGRITMNNAALGAGAVIGFGLNNSVIGSTDVLVVNITNANGVSVLKYRAEAHILAVGVGFIKVTNVSSESLSEAVAINFAIIKGATA